MICAVLLGDELGGCSWTELGIRAPFSRRWSCLSYWARSLFCTCMCRRGRNGFAQLPSLWHWNFVLSVTPSTAPILCFSLPSTHHLYSVHVQAVRLPCDTSLHSFISDGAVFQVSHLRDLCGLDLCDSLGEGLAGQWLGPAMP